MTDRLDVQYGASVYSSEQLQSRLHSLNFAAKSAIECAKSPENWSLLDNFQLNDISRETDEILKCLHQVMVAVEHDNQDENHTARSAPSEPLDKQIIDIQTRLLFIQSHLTFLLTRRQVKNDVDYIKKIVLETIEQSDRSDDVSSIGTFYTASSILFAEREIWKAFQKQLRNNLTLDMIQNDPAAIMEILKNQSYTNSNVTVSQSHRRASVEGSDSDAHPAALKSRIDLLDMNLPCYILPRKSVHSFFGRENELRTLRERLVPSTSKDNFRSLVFHGYGGVGKSIIAQQFVTQEIHRLDAVIWVNAMSKFTLERSFNEIATRLDLQDADPGHHKKGRVLVLNWLRRTRELLAPRGI